MARPKELYKVELTYWFDETPHGLSCEDMGREVTVGGGFCSDTKVTCVTDPKDFPDTEFFGVEELDEEAPLTYSTCQNCGRKWHDELLEDIKDLTKRVAPGEPMPSGECPDCGALCQPDKET